MSIEEKRQKDLRTGENMIAGTTFTLKKVVKDEF